MNVCVIYCLTIVTLVYPDGHINHLCYPTICTSYIIRHYALQAKLSRIKGTSLKGFKSCYNDNNKKPI